MLTPCESDLDYDVVMCLLPGDHAGTHMSGKLWWED